MLLKSWWSSEVFELKDREQTVDCDSQESAAEGHQKISRMKSYYLRIALALPLVSLAIPIYLMFTVPVPDGSWAWFPGLADGIQIFFGSCILSLTLIIVLFFVRFLRGIWIKNTMNARLAVYLLAGVGLAGLIQVTILLTEYF